MAINLDYKSPNFGDRPTDSSIDTLILHYTGMQTGQEALERLCNPEAQVSAHYLIEEDGRTFQLVEEGNRAWHAGVACWKEERDINSCSIGIEIVNPGHEWGYRPFPEEQMTAVAALCQDILSRHPIPPERVLGHSDIAPERKEDPGELFDWMGLAIEGIGLFPKGDRQTKGIESIDFLSQLEAYGYQLDHSASESPLTKSAIVAFQRHFRPSLLDGEIDEECCQILANLHSQLDANM